MTQQIHFSSFLIVFLFLVEAHSIDTVPRQHAKYNKTIEELSKVGAPATMSQWQYHMGDFAPSDLMTLEIEPKSLQQFYVDIEEVGTNVKGFYFVSSNREDIDFVIYNPEIKVVFSRKGMEGLFYFSANQKGTYTFEINNEAWLKTKQVTFAIHVGNVTEDPLVNTKDLSPMEIKIQEHDRRLQEVQTEIRFANKRQAVHYSHTEKTHSKVFYLTVAESLVILGVTIWQVYYIKRLLDNRRII